MEMSSWETSEKERFRQEEGGRKGKRGVGQGGGVQRGSHKERQIEGNGGREGEIDGKHDSGRRTIGGEIQYIHLLWQYNC